MELSRKFHCEKKYERGVQEISQWIASNTLALNSSPTMNHNSISSLSTLEHGVRVLYFTRICILLIVISFQNRFKILKFKN